jgi:hypothetical protein
LHSQAMPRHHPPLVGLVPRHVTQVIHPISLLE